MCRQKGMHNLMFEFQEDVDDEHDVWIIYKEDKDLPRYQSLANSLWNVYFDSQEAVQTYQVEHSIFYEMISKEDGKKQLANMIKTICELLENISNIGTMYANLRLENIVIRIDENKTRIEGMKFLSFGHLISIEDSEKLTVPDQVDHLPPDMLRYLSQNKNFS